MKTFSLLSAILFCTAAQNVNQLNAVKEYSLQPKTISVTTHQINSSPKGATEILMQSTDNGKTWSDISTMLPKNQKSRLFSVQGEELFAVTVTNQLYVSENLKTDNWELQDIPSDADTKWIRGIYPGRNGVYVTLNDHGFYRQTKGTNHWLCMDKMLNEKSIYKVIENADGTILVCTLTGIYESADDCKTWKHIFSDSWIGPITSKGNVMIANSTNGLMRSTDGGAHWDCVIADKGGIYNNIKVIDGRFFAIREAGPWFSSADNNPQRAYTSYDDGQTWSRIDDGGFLSDTRIYDIVQSGAFILCSYTDGTFSRSADGGKTWEVLTKYSNGDKPLRFNLMVSDKIVFAVIAPPGC